jgi:HJR/Mrr/RecB family endonuclease
MGTVQVQYIARLYLINDIWRMIFENSRSRGHYKNATDKKSVSTETKKFPPTVNIYQTTLSSFPEKSSLLNLSN